MSSKSNLQLSAVLHKAGDLRMEERPIPEPGPGEVQIAVRSVGICGTDIHYLTHGGFGDIIIKSPITIGHESCGVVSKLGPGVTHLKVGDRVGIEPGLQCRKCEYCVSGRYNLCPDIQPLGMPPYEGTLRRYHVHDASLCLKLPDHVTDDEAAVLEPLSCGIYACRKGGISWGNTVLICGAGPIGLLIMLAARAMGASKIAITDIAQGRLELAKKLGADHVIKVDPSLDAISMAKAINETMELQPDVTLECTGVESSIQTAIYATKAGGVMVIVGLGKADVTIPLVHAATREIDIRAIFGHAHSYPAALQMIASRQIDVKPLITHRFPLEKTREALETARTGAGGAIKVVIHCGQD